MPSLWTGFAFTTQVKLSKSPVFSLYPDPCQIALAMSSRSLLSRPAEPTPSEVSTLPDLAFFSSIPWIALDGFGTYWKVRPLSWRTTPQESPSSETFFARTLNSLDTIGHFCMLSPRPRNSISPPPPPIALIALIHLGPGLAGHPGVCHGGVLSTVLDEVMGTLVFHYAGKNSPGHVTASLTVDYVKPVAVPGVIMVRAEQESSEGRKTRVSAEVTGIPHGSEDQDGTECVCARGKALFIELRK